MSEEENYLDNLLKNMEEPLKTDEAAEAADMEEAPLPDVTMTEEEPPVMAEALAAEEMPIAEAEPPIIEEEPLIAEENLPIMEEAPVLEEVSAEEVPLILDEPDIADELKEVPLILDEPDIADELNLDALEMPETPDLELPDIENIDILPEVELADTVSPESEDAQREEPELATEDFELPDVDLTLEEENELNLEDLKMPEDELQLQDDLNIDGLEEAIQSETELQMAGNLNDELNDLNIDEMDFGMDTALADAMTEKSDISDDLGLSDGAGTDDAVSAPEKAGELEEPDLLDTLDIDDAGSEETDDNLDDVLSMLDNDADLAEINDMLKKSDNNEPIEDDMMNLLNQMADDEAASVNAGVHHVDEDDGGVPLPKAPESVSELEKEAAEAAAAEKSGKKKKESKRNKKNAGANTNMEAAAPGEEAEEKKPGKLGRFFNMLTEDLVPEPTEEELAAEKAEKEAKKQEEQTKKEEEKQAKDAAKQAKAEEAEAAKKAKAEAAAQKKKEKQAEKDKKAAAKKAKHDAEAAKKGKRIPPKKMAIAALFGASVCGAILVASNILSKQGYLQTAKNAYYNQDYKGAYQATYGMDLDPSESDGLIQARSEVILKIQCRYDSYQNNLKMGREVEALDALLQGIATYDYINADAEQYGVVEEVDAVMADILNTLQVKYGLDESAARELMNNDDALSYTMALNEIVSGG